MLHRGAIRWRATLLMLGTIIGAGIFGVPAMIGEWGVIPSAIGFVCITGAILAAHLYYAEAVLGNPDHAHLAGQAGYWLGAPFRHVGGTIQSLQIFGSILAYIILGGDFLASFLSVIGFHPSLVACQYVFWIVGSLVAFFGLQIVSKVEGFLTWLLVGVILLLIGVYLRMADLSLVLSVPGEWHGFEPYGVILFSIIGITSLPEAANLVGFRRDDTRKAVIRSTFLAAVLTYMFGASAWMASGGALGRDPSELVSILPPVLAFAIPLFGVLAIITSYIASVLDLRDMFRHDYRFPLRFAFIVTVGIPLLLFLFTSRDFLSTVGLVGSVFGAFLAILVTLMGRKALLARKGSGNRVILYVQRHIIPVVVIAFFLFGGVVWYLS